MLIHPQFDPVAIQLGPLAVHWYGLMYLLAFVFFIVLGRMRIKKGHAFMSNEKLDDLLTYGVFGVVIGGRLGEVIFYQPAYYLQHPLEVFMIWQGGMSFHGGFLGVLAALWIYAKKHQHNFWDLTDFVVPLVPLGLAFGRLGNFINGELWGRLAPESLPWGMIFPQARRDDLIYIQDHPDWMMSFVQNGGLVRHPSQIYQMLLEGLLLFALVWIFSQKPRLRAQVTAVFLMGYGCFRFIAEYFRSPDAGIFGQSDIISMGQWLSVPMVLAGLFLYWNSQKKQIL